MENLERSQRKMTHLTQQPEDIGTTFLKCWKKNKLNLELWFAFTVLLYIVCFLGPHLRHMEVPRLGVELELQLPAYTTATATWYLSHNCDLHHSSRQCRILNALSEARDGTCILMDTSRIRLHWATTETPTWKFPLRMKMTQECPLWVSGNEPN